MDRLEEVVSFAVDLVVCSWPSTHGGFFVDRLPGFAEFGGFDITLFIHLCLLVFRIRPFVACRRWAALLAGSS